MSPFKKFYNLGPSCVSFQDIRVRKFLPQCAKLSHLKVAYANLFQKNVTKVCKIICEKCYFEILYMLSHWLQLDIDKMAQFFTLIKSSFNLFLHISRMVTNFFQIRLHFEKIIWLKRLKILNFTKICRKFLTIFPQFFSIS